MSQLPEVTCDVCRERPSIGAASIPGVPITAAYCQECLNAGAQPYDIVVANTAVVGGLDHAADWWLEIVSATLQHLKISRAQFRADVRREIREWKENADG